MPRYRVFTILFVSILATSASAAPPTVTYLFPAGAARGQSLEITAGGTFERWPVQTWVSRPGLEVKAAKDKGKLIVAASRDALPGKYWIRLFDEQGASSLRPFLVGTLPELLEKESNDDFKKPQMLASPNVVVNGRFDKTGDVDVFGVTLHKGQMLVASIEANRTLASPMDSVLQLLDAKGFVLEQNHDDHDLDPQLTYTAPADGTYLVRAFAFPSTPDSSIRFAGGDTFIYRLTLTTQAFADHAYPLAVSRANPGNTQLRGWNLGPDTREIVIPSADFNDEVELSHPLLGNTVAVQRVEYPVIVETEPNDRQHPQAITLPVVISGHIDSPEDLDVYQFQAAKGQKLVFRVEARSLCSPLDPVLRLSDSTGKLITQIDDSGSRRDGTRDAELNYSVTQDGTFRIEVRDLHDSGSERHFYRLSVFAPQPSFDLTVATDRFTITPDKPLEIVVTVVRRDGFDREIEVQLENVPEGAVTTPMKSLGTGATAKTVTLKITSTKESLAQSIRIVGDVPDQAKERRFARTPITAFNTTTSDFWLAAAKTAPPAEPKKKKK